jgi:hypothetical protein
MELRWIHSGKYMARLAAAGKRSAKVSGRQAGKRRKKPGRQALAVLQHKDMVFCGFLGHDGGH